MSVNEIHHSLWGSNFANQIVAHEWKGLGNLGAQYDRVTEQYTNFLGFTRTRKKMVYVGEGWVETTDDNKIVTRRYQHRCGLLKIVMTPHRDGSMFVAFLEGHVTSTFISSEMEFRFAPDELKKNDGKPIAEVWFHGIGTRRGPLSHYGTSRIICTFADKGQMDQYLDLANRRMPNSIIHLGESYSATSTGTYQSSSGSALPNLLVLYYLLSTTE